MGWASGSYAYDTVAMSLKAEFGAKNVGKQKRVLRALIEWLEVEDCDTLDECWGISEVSDLALQEAGYHEYVPGKCSESLESYPDPCACGFVY